ncbi:hypothetical protein BOTBODRAFT_64952 [Botryobasidium botryosum FD-172 SS1]|uniref:Carbonic anhydrase n=1 Tax=Botryobasidium botryosum (strain FD-172 SS1) TaxID=930990 RepID=A0A067MXX4_BOTB1|nr:hypothetical protein BOTBODRAFT_64952 [Botryobasidium botryosum FD-172 SS1]
MLSRIATFLGLSLITALASPVHIGIADGRSLAMIRDVPAPPEITALLQGNQQFRDDIATSSDPTLLVDLAKNGQKPDFMFLGCRDSRVSEGTIFDAQPGTLFTQRNIGNQFNESDNNVNSVLAYILAYLTVRHVLVVGHIGCGGVGAAIASAPTPPLPRLSFQAWVQPIRELYQTSDRAEIVALRTANAANTTVAAPPLDNPGYIALVEENVKRVKSIVSSQHWAAYAANSTALEPVFVHGWVYDIRNGSLYNLKVTQGPPGVAIS